MVKCSEPVSKMTLTGYELGAPTNRVPTYKASSSLYKLTLSLVSSFRSRPIVASKLSIFVAFDSNMSKAGGLGSRWTPTAILENNENIF